MPLTSARYAAVTSTLALAVALGGTSYAAVRIGTKDLKDGAVTTAKIKDGAVTTAKIKNGTVTGVDVKESTLARVPNADTAVFAADAGTVGGVTVTPVDLVRGTGAGRPRFVFLSEGLDIELRCIDAGSFDRPGLFATTSRTGADLVSVVVPDTTPQTVLETDIENDTFGPGGEVDLLAGDDGDVAQTTFTYRDPSGSVVQGTLFTDSVPGSEPCRVTGFITSR